MANMSGTSLTRSDGRRAVRTFATIRIVGDDLVPDQITKLFKLVPTQAYAKGELYNAGSRSGDVRGRTGVWYLSTDQLVASDRLSDHLAFLLMAVVTAPQAHASTAAQLLANIAQLKQLLQRKSLRAVVTCFWAGPAGTKRPTIPRYVSNLLKAIPIEIETDFDDDAEPPNPMRILATA
jgi:hypothetical protein